MFDYLKDMREIKRRNRVHHVAMYMEIREGLRILSSIHWDPQALVQIPKLPRTAWDAAKMAGIIKPDNPLHLKIQRVYLGFMLLNEKSETAIQASFNYGTGDLRDRNIRELVSGMMKLAQRIHRWVIPLAQEVCEEIERRYKLTKEEIDKIESELTRRMNKLMGS